MEFGMFLLEVGIVLARAIGRAITSGDASILDKPVRELLGGELTTTITKRAADARAEQKFGAGT